MKKSTTEFLLNKLTLATLSVVFFCSIPGKSIAKDESKLPEVTVEMLKQENYLADTTATAIALYDIGTYSYAYIGNRFYVISKVKRRVQILKNEGTEYATFNIPYYSNRAKGSEKVFRIKAYSYNLENGKVIKTKLDKDYIFDEEINQNYSKKKVAIPNAKKGTIIEYEYTKQSPFFSELPTWYFQSEIPTLHSSLTITTPEYFDFSIETMGYENIKHFKDSKTLFFNIRKKGQNSRVSCKGNIIHFQSDSVPALKDVSHIWNIRDYLTRVEFELKGVQFPYEPYKPYTQTWEDIEKTIEKYSGLPKYIKTKTPYQKELSERIANIESQNKKIESIYQLVKEKIKWNNKYAFSSNPKKAIKEGAGDNAQINSVLISLLNQNNIKAYPVLLSRRSIGRLPFTHPSYDKLNTFIVAAEGENNKTYYLDGSAYYGGLNMLPTDLLVERARTFKQDTPNKWVNLTNISENRVLFYIDAEITADAKINGTLQTLYESQEAYDYKRMYNSLPDSTKYIEAFESNFDVKVNAFSIKAVKELTSNKVAEHIEFSKDIMTNGDFIYVNPLIFFQVKENPFKESERKLPIEMDAPYTYAIMNTLTIPPGYTVDEIPKSNITSLQGTHASFQYLIKSTKNIVQINYKLKIEDVIYGKELYKALQEFWANVLKKNNEVIVLKKSLN